ncbi:hypothetical protein LUZ60_012466 [Juncus effusus]|nr:hypothetical protein LUZ60_012466 [Juncus effusus]
MATRILLLTFFFSCFISISISISDHESFLHCFSNQIKPSIISSEIIFTPITSQYLASIRNLRLLDPKATKPFFTIKPTNVRHIQATVICAKDNGFHIRVKSGGHDYEGLSYREVNNSQPFVILDLVNLNEVEVDVNQGTAWVQAGATLGELYYKIGNMTNHYGFPAGTCPTIGTGGHLSGGGLNTMMRKYGLASDNILDIILVDANGDLLDKNSMGDDQFWAIRGGGGMSFGIVVSWKVRLVPVPSIVTAFSLNKLGKSAMDLVTKWQTIAPKLREDLFIRVIIFQVNEGGERNVQTQFNSLFLGRCDELLQEMAVSFPELEMERKDCNEASWVESTLYFGFYTTNIPKEALLNRSHIPSYSKGKSDFVMQPIPKSVFYKIWPRFLEDDSATLVMDPFGGEMDNISETDTPFPHRKGNLYNIQYISSWSKNDTTVYKRRMNWVEDTYNELAPYVSANPRGAYVNYRDLELGVNEIQGNVNSYAKGRIWGEKYFKGNFEKLSIVKGKVDPFDFFRHEQSIPPFPPAKDFDRN